MARPKKNNADYFSHDAGMRNHGKIKALRKKFGFEGYSVWCMLLELLTSKDGFKCKWNELNIEITAGDFDIDSVRLVEIVEYLKLLELVAVENGFLFSPNHIERFSGLIAKRTRDNTRYEQQKESETPKKRVSVSENPQSKVKEIKENNITVIFDKFRKAYPGTKRGLKTELDNFLKKNKPEIVNLLSPALEKEISHKDKLRELKLFCPEWKNLQTWINQKCWEQELPEISANGKQQTTTKNNSKPKVKQYEMGVR